MSVNSQLNSISANFNHLKDKFIHVSKGANEHEKAIIWGLPLSCGPGKGG
jgi:hypothetical protein